MRPTRLLGSSSFRLALVYMALFGASVLILLAFIYWSTAGYMARQMDATIEAEIQGLAEQYRRRGLAGLSSLINERLTRNPRGSSLYLLTDPRYVPLLGNLRQWPLASSAKEAWLDFPVPSHAGGQASRPGRARQFQLRGGFRLLVGRDVHELQELQGLMLRALAGGLGITLILALVGGSAMSRSLLKRIESINDTSRDIMAGNLSQRIPTRGTNDDLDQLGANLNAMLDRIEALMEDVRRVSDNIAHDLRTPLSRLRTQLEKLDRDSSAGRDAIVSEAIAEADALLCTFNALLRIARLESGGAGNSFETVDAGTIARDVAELYEPLAERKGQQLSIDLEPRSYVHGDRDLLFQAAANLLDNAIKYTPLGGSIELTLGSQGGQIQLEVCDTGPGIPWDLRDKVLQRFYRLEPSRTTPGNGLGLSLVRAVTQLHGAQLRLSDNQPGLRVSLLLPVAEAACTPSVRHAGSRSTNSGRACTPALANPHLV